MDAQRKKYVAEMTRMANAVMRTKSPKLKNDYLKAIRRMERELAEYDRYKKGAGAWEQDIMTR